MDMMPFVLVTLVHSLCPEVAGFMLSGTFSSNHHQTCMNTSECPPHKNLVCFHVYEGCSIGHCTCDPHNSTSDAHGNCMPVVLRGGDMCGRHRGVCKTPMTCTEGVCRCPRRHFLSSNMRHCLEYGTRLVGERCNLREARYGRQKCSRQTPSGFTQNDVSCSTTTGLCSCSEGFKTHKYQCLTRRLSEYGCTTSMHCEGGAVCSGGKCVCPTGYIPDDDNYKCLRNGAITNVDLGGSCDEVSEKRYCAPGLVCYRCAHEQHDKCIRFLLSTNYGISSTSLLPSPSFLIFLFLLLNGHSSILTS